MTHATKLNFHVTSTTIWIALGILLLGGFVRLVAMDAYISWSDEHAIVQQTIGIVEDGDRPLVGPIASVEGVTGHSPLTLYMLASWIYLIPDSGMTRIFVALNAMIALALWFAFLKRYFGTQVAIIGGITLAVLPLAIDWGRWVWNPNLGHHFLVLWFFTALLGYYEGKRWAQMAHWFVLSLNIHAQAAMFLLVPFTLLLVVWYLWQSPENRMRTLLLNGIGSLICVLSLLPWIIGLQQAEADALGGQINDTSAVSGLMSRINFSNIRLLPNTFGVLTGSTGFPQEHDDWAESTGQIEPFYRLNAFGWVQATLTAIGAGTLIVWTAKAPKARFKWGFLAFMTLVPMSAIVLLESGIIQDWYLLPVLFAGTAIFAIAMDCLLRITDAPVKQALLIGLMVIWGSQLVQFGAYLRFIGDAALTHTSGNYATMSDQFRAWSADNPNIVILQEFEVEQATLTSDERFKMAENYASWHAMMLRFPIEFVQVAMTLPVPQEGATLIGVEESVVINEWFRDLPTKTINREYAPDLASVTISETMLNELTDSLYDYSGISRLHDVSALACSSDTAELRITWQSLIEPHDKQYQFSLRLLDGEGSTVMQRDFSSLAGQYWHPDHINLTHVVVEKPSNAEQVQLVMYELNGGGLGMTNVPLDCGD